MKEHINIRVGYLGIRKNVKKTLKIFVEKNGNITPKLFI